MIIEAVLTPDVRFSPDGSLLAVGGGEPIVMDARTRRVLAGLRIGRDRILYALRFSPDGRTLFAALANPGEGVTTISASTRLQPAARHRAARRPRPGHADAHKRRPPARDELEDGPTVIRDARTLRPLKSLPVGARGRP